MRRTIVPALALFVAHALFLFSTRPVLAGDIFIPDANPASGGMISLPWGQREVRYQAFVSAARMGGKKVRITDLSFAPAVSGTFTAGQIEIRMAQTAQPFQLIFANNFQRNLTQVYAGPITWSYKAGQWSRLGLTAPFVYDGADNVVVEIRFRNGNGGPRCYGGQIPVFLVSGTGAYNAPQGGNILLRVAPKMRFHVADVQLIASGTAAPGSVVDFALVAPNDFGLAYQLGTSLGAGPTRIDARSLPLTVDALLVASVSGTLPAVFERYAGRLDGAGKATARLHIPPFPFLRGVRLHSAYVTLDANASSGVKSISDPAVFTIR